MNAIAPQIHRIHEADIVRKPLSVNNEKYHFIVSRNPCDYEPVRNKIKSEIDKRFYGWSNEHDRQFDDSSIFFLLKDDTGQLKAAIRMVISRPGGAVVPASQTTGEVRLDFSNSLEYSGLWFDRFCHCLCLAGMVGRWVASNFPDQDVFGIFESSNRVIQRIYLRSFGMEVVDHPPIQYQGFRYIESGDTVLWQLSICRRESRIQRSEQLLRSANASTMD